MGSWKIIYLPKRSVYASPNHHKHEAIKKENARMP